MFWHKKESANWVLLFFGFIAIGIILSVVLLIVILNRKTIENTNTPLNKIEINIVSQTELNNNYQAEVKGLSDWLTAQPDTITEEQLFIKVEETFLTVRVPGDKRENHLATFLAIEKLKTNKTKLTIVELKKTLLGEIGNLIK